MEPTSHPAALNPGGAGASPRRSPAASRRGAGDDGAAASSVVRINHALEPALRAAAQWRHAQRELEQLDRAHRRQRAAIISRQQRANAQLAAFMAKTCANREWLTALLDLPAHAGDDTQGVDDGR